MDREVTAYRGSHIVAVLAEEERSQRWLARKMGMRFEHLNRVLNGHHPITRGFVRRACDVLGVPEEGLFFLDHPIHACMTEEPANVA